MHRIHAGTRACAYYIHVHIHAHIHIYVHVNVFTTDVAEPREEPSHKCDSRHIPSALAALCGLASWEQLVALPPARSKCFILQNKQTKNAFKQIYVCMHACIYPCIHVYMYTGIYRYYQKY
jgi:hypothetical protein